MFAQAAKGFFGGVTPGPLVLFSFHEKRKKIPKKKFTGCMNFAKNRTLFPKMPKLGTLSLKQCAFLNGKRVLFFSRKIYEAGPMSGRSDIASLVARC